MCNYVESSHSAIKITVVACEKVSNALVDVASTLWYFRPIIKRKWVIEWGGWITSIYLVSSAWILPKSPSMANTYDNDSLNSNNISTLYVSFIDCNGLLLKFIHAIYKTMRQNG